MASSRTILGVGVFLSAGWLFFVLWAPQRLTEHDGAVLSPHRRLLTVKSLKDPLQASSSGVPVPCFMMHCPAVLLKCGLEKSCRSALMCNNACAKQPANKQPGCNYLCEMIHGKGSDVYVDFLKCAGSANCIAHYPADGKCLATDKDALQTITSMDQLAGGWLVTRGINCGDDVHGDKLGGGGYDWYPCQHERFLQNDKKQWINNITYCGGSNGGLKQCTTPIIDTVANVSLPSPGVIHHLYVDAPLMPQDEYWRIVDRPHPDWIFVIWCGNTPLLPYNGGIVLSRAARDDSAIPAAVRDSFVKTAKKFGVDYDLLCPSDNKGCP